MKATANCICQTCGAVFEKTAIKRNSREAQNWITWAEATYDKCSECSDKEFSEAGQQAADESSAEGLPALTGTEKQILWAEQIRRERINQMNAILNQFEAQGEAQGVENTKLAISHLIATQTKASWWIENREANIKVIIKNSYKAAKAAQK